jgi:uncharacterized repeat protein (TIGR03803 family)
MKWKMLVCLSLIASLASLAPAADAQTFSVIHNFTNGFDGGNPTAGVTLRGGALFGTAAYGGRQGRGSVYQMTHLGNQWGFNPISDLPNYDGAFPMARVVFGPDGHLYGTTEDYGTVFNLIAPISICKAAFCPWTQDTLHTFLGTPDGRQTSLGDLIWDKQGNIYGTTAYGGQYDYGTVFEMMPSGSGWMEAPIYSFSHANGDGAYPETGVVFDKNGNLFGTTERGGAYNFGTIYELKYVVGVGWTESIIYSFQNADDGAFPDANLIFDSAGNLYGATLYGGEGGTQGGTVFKLSPSGDTWTFNLLYTFSGRPGCGPQAALTLDAAGNLYGTTQCDGANAWGNVFKLAKTQNSWVYTSLYDFTGNADGLDPISNVSIDTDGSLYGTTYYGGSAGYGVVWQIKP